MSKSNTNHTNNSHTNSASGTLKYTSSVPSAQSLLEQLLIAEKWVPPRNVNDFIMLLAKLFRSLNSTTTTTTAHATSTTTLTTSNKTNKVVETDLNTPNSTSQKQASQIPVPLPAQRLFVRILFIRVDTLDTIESGLSLKMSQLAKVCIHMYVYICMFTFVSILCVY